VAKQTFQLARCGCTLRLSGPVYTIPDCYRSGSNFVGIERL
jgi:hypothetical protein